MKIRIFLIAIFFITCSIKTNADEKNQKFCNFTNDIPAQKLLVETSIFGCSEESKQKVLTENKTKFSSSFQKSLDFFNDKCKSLDSLSDIPGLIQFSARNCIQNCEKATAENANANLCDSFCEAKWSKVSLYFVSALKRNKIQLEFKGKDQKVNAVEAVKKILKVEDTANK